MARIVVCGYIIRHPLAGNMHAFLSYVAGLSRLGHEVTYIEESGWDASCFDPNSQCHTDDPTAGIAAFRTMLSAYCLDTVPFAFVDRKTYEVHGNLSASLKATFTQADLVINVGGVCWLEEFEHAARRALIDMDPLFTQLGRFAQTDLSRYDALFTYGQNINGEDCLVPTLERRWVPVLPPVVTDFWDNAEGAEDLDLSNPRFTTVANWSAYGDIVFRDEVFGQKNLEFEKIIDLPELSDAEFELATENMGEDVRHRFIQSGWRIIRGRDVTLGATAYAEYLRESTGEFSVAKNAYVKSRSGWISDRTVCYLATGRPAIVQDTGAGGRVEAGEGFLTFNAVGDAVECVADVLADYDLHRRRAREIAREIFDYSKVLPGLVEAALA